MGNYLNSFKAYEEGVLDGIYEGQQSLLLQLLRKKLGTLSNKYIDIIEGLDSKSILNLSMNIFEIYNLCDLDKFLLEKEV